MSEHATITVTAYWDRDAPDGSACCVCWEACYLNMWRMYYTVGKSDRRVPLDLWLCGSCYELELGEDCNQ